MLICVSIFRSEIHLIEFKHPLQSFQYKTRSFADGSLYEEKKANIGLRSSWEGPCFYLKASLGFKTFEEMQCDTPKGFICEWKGKTFKVFFIFKSFLLIIS